MAPLPKKLYTYFCERPTAFWLEMGNLHKHGRWVTFALSTDMSGPLLLSSLPHEKKKKHHCSRQFSSLFLQENSTEIPEDEWSVTEQ